MDANKREFGKRTYQAFLDVDRRDIPDRHAADERLIKNMVNIVFMVGHRPVLQ
jgi:hypothetical protein